MKKDIVISLIVILVLTAIFSLLVLLPTEKSQDAATIETEEQGLCLVEQFTWQEVNDGYAIFTDYGAKSYIMLSTVEGIKIYEEEVSDRSNCIE